MLRPKLKPLMRERLPPPSFSHSCRSSVAGVQCLSNPSQLRAIDPVPACDRAGAASSLSLIISSWEMAEFNGDRDSGLWMVGVWGIVAILLILRWLYGAIIWQGRQPPIPRGRGVPADYQLVEDLGFALALPAPSRALQIFPNVDPEGQFNVPLVDQPPAIQEPMQNINADHATVDEVALEILPAVAEVASLPRQIEREANMVVSRRQELSSVVESAAPEHLPPQSDVPAPEVVGILAGVLPLRIVDECKDLAEARVEVEAEMEVEVENFLPRLLELIMDAERFPQFATPGLTVPAGGLESNLEERVPGDHPEAGDSSADFQAEVTIQDDVVEEPHA